MGRLDVWYLYPNGAPTRTSTCPPRSPGCYNACQDYGREHELGRRENYYHYLQFHAGILLLDGVQVDADRIRLGPTEQGHVQQPPRIPALSLREGSNVAVGSLPGLLHGSCREFVELQLHGCSTCKFDEVRSGTGDTE